MKLKVLALAVMVSLGHLLTGCESGDDTGYGLRGYTSTGVTPEAGSFSFNQEGSFSVVDDPATGLRSVRFSRDGFRYDHIPVQNGTFFLEHGEIGGTHCPTDGYAISGHFVTSTVAEGQIAYATDCRVTARVEFAAQK